MCRARVASVCRVAVADGNGWVQCRCGRRHWGRHGAAGLLLVRQGQILLQLRAQWTHLGGTWSTPGGAIDSHETPVVAALREAAEENAIPSEAVEVVDIFPSVAHPDWTYHFVLGLLRDDVQPLAANDESEAVAWLLPDDVDSLPLHPGFAVGWPTARDRLLRLTTLNADVRTDRP